LTLTEVGSGNYVGTHFRCIGKRVGLVGSMGEKNRAREVVKWWWRFTVYNAA